MTAESGVLPGVKATMLGAVAGMGELMRKLAIGVLVAAVVAVAVTVALAAARIVAEEERTGRAA